MCDYHAAVWLESWHVARKEHVCFECETKINVAEKYKRIFMAGGGADTCFIKMHAECYEFISDERVRDDGCIVPGSAREFMTDRHREPHERFTLKLFEEAQP